MKKSSKIALIVVSCVLVLILSVGMIAYISVKNASNRKVYKIGKEEIPSITSIVGERKALSVERSTVNGVKTKKTEYASESVQNDLAQYTLYLREECGFLVTKDYDLTEVPSAIYLAKKAEEEGYLIMVTIQYDLTGYTVICQEGRGELNYI